jgi:hypothetical protein
MSDVRFYTRGIRNMTVVMKPTFTTMVNGFPTVTQGKRITFINGEYKTSDKEEIEFLKSQKNFNSMFFAEEIAKPKVKV